MTKPPQPTAEQLANDPSLCWTPYRQWELVWSDTHQTELRFVRYEGSMARLASLNSMAELPELVPPLRIRRASLMQEERLLSTDDRKGLMGALHAYRKME